MQKLTLALAGAFVAVTVAGCGIVYHPPREQGNLLSEAQVAKLHPGMTKQQVISVLGTPSIMSPFDNDRWDYVHTTTRRGGKQETSRFTLFFKNGVLASTQGKLFSANTKQMLEQANIYHEAGAADNDDTKGDKD